MTKPLKIAPWVITHDLQAIYDYHQQFSATKSMQILAEYDRVISLLEINPRLFHTRENGWRVTPLNQEPTYCIIGSMNRCGWSPDYSMPAVIPHGSGMRYPGFNPTSATRG